MVCHLSDSFRAVMGRRPVSHASNVLQQDGREMDRPLRAPAAGRRESATRPELDQAAGGAPRPASSRRTSRDLEALVEVFTATPRTFDWQPHPIFGAMSDAAWLRWGYLHMDHHLRQFGA